MKLSHVERMMLSNQYRILELLDKENAGHYARRREIVDSGYELEYAEDWLEGEVPEADCREVHKILQMHAQMQHAQETLGAASGVTDTDVAFIGFDGNNETSHLGYARHLRAGGLYGHVKVSRFDDLNAHMPTIERYRRQLAVLEKVGDPNDLSVQDLKDLVAAQKHPDRR